MWGVDSSNYISLTYLNKKKKTDPKGNIIGLVIISRCSNCGKINAKTIYIETNYGQ